MNDHALNAIVLHQTISRMKWMTLARLSVGKRRAECVREARVRNWTLIRCLNNASRA